MYQALYRKWRPRVFDDVVGQNHITDTLKNQVKSGRLSHAYLFIGTRGTGKTSCAKILAKAVNCEHPENGNPCNKCKSCIGIDDGSILDVVELDAASNNGVDNVRALRDEAVFSPAVARKRVYIIDEVHMLSSSAFNALLKILEEPPEHLMFILATTELHKVPATILSRCQRYSFKRIDSEIIERRLSFIAERENMKLDPGAASLLARLADGSLRDGLSLLDQCSGYEFITAENVLLSIGLAGNLRIAELLGAVAEKNTSKALALFEDMWADGKSPSALLKELAVLMRDILMTKVAPNGGRNLLSGGFDLETTSSFAKRMTAEDLVCCIDSVQWHIGSLRDGRDPKIAAELCIIKLCEPELGGDIESLHRRIYILESAILESSAHIPHSSKEPCVLDTDNEVSYPPNKVVSGIYDKCRDISLEDNNSSTKSEELSGLDNGNLNLDDEPPFDADERTINTTRSEKHSPVELGSQNIPSVDTESAEAELSAQKDNLDFWTKMLADLKISLLPGQYNLVSSEQKAKGIFDGATFEIIVSDGFVRGQLEQPAVINSIRNAAAKAVGRVVPVKITVGREIKSANTDKLDRLANFPNVKFE